MFHIFEYRTFFSVMLTFKKIMAKNCRICYYALAASVQTSCHRERSINCHRERHLCRVAICFFVITSVAK